MKKLNLKEIDWKTEIERYFFMLVACVLYALAMNLFVVPNKIVSGGITGAATLVNILTGISIGIVTVALNLPILLMGLKTQGLGFIIRCFITNAALGDMIDLLSFLPAMTTNPLIAAIYGGVLQGLAIGLFYRYSMSSGGTELLGRVICKYVQGISPAKMISLLDAVIVVTGAFALKNPENVLMALIMIFLNAKVSDMIITGTDYAKMCYIITDKPEEVSQALMSNSRGITNLSGIGMYTKTERHVLMTVIKKSQFIGFKKTVRTVDPKAFVIVSEAAEVLGNGFKSITE